MRDYSYQRTHYGDGRNVWEITEGPDFERVVWSCPYLPEHSELDEPPLEVREKYEELLGPEGIAKATAQESINVVELAAAADDEDNDCAFDQPCAYGHRVEGHAVYCHNTAWLYAPSKCRRTWYTDGEVRDEDCPGYKPNPRYLSA